jgi:hypothetical protein
LADTLMPCLRFSLLFVTFGYTLLYSCISNPTYNVFKETNILIALDSIRVLMSKFSNV